jgi:hypothetical protein
MKTVNAMGANVNHATITGHKSPVKMMVGSKITANAMDANVISVNHASHVSHVTIAISAEMLKTVGMGKTVTMAREATTNLASKTVLKRYANLPTTSIRR